MKPKIRGYGRGLGGAGSGSGSGSGDASNLAIDGSQPPLDTFGFTLGGQGDSGHSIRTAVKLVTTLRPLPQSAEIRRRSTDQIHGPTGAPLVETTDRANLSSNSTVDAATGWGALSVPAASSLRRSIRAEAKHTDKNLPASAPLLTAPEIGGVGEAAGVGDAAASSALLALEHRVSERSNLSSAARGIRRNSIVERPPAEVMPNDVEPVSFCCGWDAQRGSRENFDLLLNDPTSSQLARAWSLLIMMTIAVSVITFITQTIQSLAAWPGWDIMERVCVAIFSLEYVGRLAGARHRLRWMLQYLNLVDLAAILPAYATFITQADSPVGFIRVVRMVSTLSTLQYLRSAR